MSSWWLWVLVWASGPVRAEIADDHVVGRAQGPLAPIQITAGRVRAYAAGREGRAPQALVQDLIDFELLAQQAQVAGLATAPEAVDAERSALVRVYLGKTFAHTWRAETVPDALVRQSYEKNRSFFTHPELRDGVHILVAHKAGDSPKRPAAPELDAVARDLAGQIHADLVASPPADREAFLARAERFRTATEAAGLVLMPQSLGRFARKGAFAEAFTDEAFKLGKGDISPPFPTQFGWHVVLVDDVVPAKDEPLSAVEASIRERVTPDVRRLELSKLVMGLKARHAVLVNPEPLEHLARRRGVAPEAAAPAGRPASP